MGYQPACSYKDANMDGKGIGWTRLTVSGIVNEGVTWIYNLVVLVSVSGALVTVYEGQDATTGKLIGSFTGIEKESKAILFPGGVRLERGLYVALAANVTEVTLFWMPE